MWPLWPEVAPHSKDLPGDMQAESCEISERSLIVVPGIAFAQGYQSAFAGKFWGGERRAVYEPEELTVSLHRVLAIVHAP